jgi:hypothetical protein
MIVKGSLGGKSTSFEELLHSLSKSPYRNRLLKTILSSKYYTNGTILTLLSDDDERKQVQKIHYDVLVSDSTYKDSKPVKLFQAVPKYLRTEIKTAKRIDVDDNLSVVRLLGSGIKQFVELENFNLLYHRVKQWASDKDSVSWWFSRQDGPIVVIKQGGLLPGDLLGTIAPLVIKQEKEQTFGKPKWKRDVSPLTGGWLYRKVGNK